MESPEYDTRQIKIPVSEKIGSVSAELMLPRQPIALFTLAHGAGTNMSHAFLKELSVKLAGKNIGTVRFNFPYTENGKKMPDKPPVATESVKAVMETIHKEYPAIPLFLSGKSFGGRMSSHLLAVYCPEYVRGIVFYGFPLHPPGNPSVERASHLKDIPVPKLFLQGTKDDLAYMNLMEGVCTTLLSSSLIKLEGANHSFKAGKRSFMNELVEETVSWVKNHA